MALFLSYGSLYAVLVQSAFAQKVFSCSAAAIRSGWNPYAAERGTTSSRHFQFLNSIQKEYNMTELNQLKQKYQPVLDVLAKEDATVQALDLQGDKLHLRATVVSEASKNHVWDAIKSVDPNF